jgi:2'-5' RNA ligase
MKKKRVFFGFPVNKILTGKLSDFKKIITLKTDYSSDYKWVKDKNYHLTLLFVGQVYENEISSICSIAEKIFGETKSFVLKPIHFTTFPHRKPKMIWLQFETSETFGKLVFDFRKSILKSDKSGQAIPHITLARLKRITIKDQSWKIEAKPELLCDTVNLYESELTPEGPIYSIIKTFKLK